MRGLIASRPVRLALVAALVLGAAFGLALVLRGRRAAPAARRPQAGQRDAEGPASPGGRETGPEPAAAAIDERGRQARAKASVPAVGNVRRSPRRRVRVTRVAAVLGVLAALGVLAVAWTLGVGDGTSAAAGHGVAKTSTGAAGASPGGCPAGTAPPCGDAVVTPVAGHAGTRSATPCATASDTTESGDDAGADAGAVAGNAAGGTGADGDGGPAGNVAGRRHAARGTVRPIDHRVTAAVNRQWRRIERWLSANAPATLARLNGPASPRLIARAEARLGTRIPDSLRASMLRHDGARGGLGFRFPPSFRLLTVRQAVAAGRATGGAACDGGWVPFAVGEDGRHLLAGSRTGEVAWRTDAANAGVPDAQSPDAHGSNAAGPDAGASDGEAAGAVGPAPSGPGVAVAWPSYYGLLKATADALVSGTLVDGARPEVTRGALEWTRR